MPTYEDVLRENKLLRDELRETRERLEMAEQMLKRARESRQRLLDTLTHIRIWAGNSISSEGASEP